MKLSKKTVDALKYISTIHPSILIRSGSVLRARNAAQNAMTKVVIDESFPMDFVIYDIRGFLKVVDLFNEPDIEFFGTTDSGYMELSEGNVKIRYRFSHPELHTNVPDDVDYQPKNLLWGMQVKLDASEIRNLLSASRVMGLDVVSFTRNSVKLSSSKDKSFTAFEAPYMNAPVLGDDASEAFSINFPTSNLMLYDDSSYEADFFICSGPKGVKLTKDGGDVTLWLGALPSSEV